MSENKNYLRSILKADPIKIRNWKKLSFYLILVIFLSLMITSISVVNYSPALETYDNGEEEIFVLRSDAGIPQIEIPRWSFILFIVSGFCVSATFIGSYLGKVLMFKDKEWLSIWAQYGETKYRRFGRKAQITTDQGNITIFRADDTYILELPAVERKDISKFGFLRMNGDYITLTSEEELFSVLHIFMTVLE